MQVLVRDRQEGKTSALIAWLLKGTLKREYPGWSRVIVCADTREVVRLTALVRKESQSIVNNHEWKHSLSVLYDLRKCVWSVDDLRHNYGYSDFDYAIDNLDLLIMYQLGLHARPDLVTMTGKLYDGKE